jgi:hypothetical protein
MSLWILFVPSAVARKLETDSGVRISLPVFETTVCIDLAAHRIVAQGVARLNVNLYVSLGLETAEAVRIAVTANAVIRVFMTILHGFARYCRGGMPGPNKQSQRSDPPFTAQPQPWPSYADADCRNIQTFLLY